MRHENTTQTVKSCLSRLTNAFARYMHCECDAKCITNARTIRNCTNGRNVNMYKHIQIAIRKCPNGLEIRQTQAGAFFLPLRLSMIFVQLFKIHYKRKGCKQPRSAPLSPAQPRSASLSLAGNQPKAHSKSVQRTVGLPKYYYILLESNQP